mgnify:CR=1 FL=1
MNIFDVEEKDYIETLRSGNLIEKAGDGTDVQDFQSIQKIIKMHHFWNILLSNYSIYDCFNKYLMRVAPFSIFALYPDVIHTLFSDEPFHTDTCYVIMLNDGIRDITGNIMMKKHISCFYTEAIASYPRVEIISPKYGIISDTIPEFVWKNQCSSSYKFQISKSNDFELLLYDEMIPGNRIKETISHTPDFHAEEGMYHIRIQSENGEWSDTL